MIVILIQYCAIGSTCDNHLFVRYVGGDFFHKINPPWTSWLISMKRNSYRLRKWIIRWILFFYGVQADYILFKCLCLNLCFVGHRPVQYSNKYINHKVVILLKIVTTEFIVNIECVKIDRNNNIIVIIIINAFKMIVRERIAHWIIYYNKHLL